MIYSSSYWNLNVLLSKHVVLLRPVWRLPAELTHLLFGLGVGLLRTLLLVPDRPDQTQLLQHGAETERGLNVFKTGLNGSCWSSPPFSFHAHTCVDGNRKWHRSVASFFFVFCFDWQQDCRRIIVAYRFGVYNSRFAETENKKQNKIISINLVSFRYLIRWLYISSGVSPS